tara:strand:- start:647 stop:1528 length:882 start_codon:yes stop_codon:yes gene_type:complete
MAAKRLSRESDSYFDHPSILDIDGHKRPNYADPVILSRSFVGTLKKRSTYFPDGILKELVSAVAFYNDGRPVYPGEPSSQHFGRGTLGKWGPNHAADPVAIMEKRVWFQSRAYVLLIQRKDTGMYALPGGMVDPGESASQTAIREMQEEAVQVNPGVIERFFKSSKHQILYSGINWNDPRNTYCAWMETTVVLFHIPKWLRLQMRLRPCAGETLKARWLDISTSNLTLLYSDHGDYVNMAADALNITCNPGHHLKFLDDQLRVQDRIIYLILGLFSCSILLLVQCCIDLEKIN